EIAVTDEFGNVLVPEEIDDDSNVSNSNYSDLKDSGSSITILSEEAEALRISTSVGGLDEATPYSLVIKARDAAENFSDASNPPITFTTRDESILPIELVDFFAIPKENHVELTW